MWIDSVSRRRGFSEVFAIFFAFDNDDVSFEDNARFSEIMGLEKFLKAVLLYHRHQEYEGLSDPDARSRLNAVAMKLGHDVKGMMKAVADLGVDDIERIKSTDLDGYLGADLIRAVEAGYMETRYPVPRSISDTFPIPGTDFTHDPLSSSGITKYIYAVCDAFFHALLAHVDFADLRKEFRERFEHRKSFGRLNNVFWERDADKTSIRLLVRTGRWGGRGGVAGALQGNHNGSAT